MTDTPEKVDYSSTLYLPQTDFPMRAGLPQKEPETVARWQKMELYKKQSLILRIYIKLKEMINKFQQGGQPQQANQQKLAQYMQ